MTPRLKILSVSTAIFAIVAVLILNGLAAHDRTMIAATQELVRAGTAQIEAELSKQRGQLLPAALELADNENTAFDVRALSMAMNLLPEEGEPSERLSTRIQSVREKLFERATALREQRPNVEGVTYVDETGRVVASSSALFDAGERLLLSEPDSDVEEGKSAVDSDEEEEEGISTQANNEAGDSSAAELQDGDEAQAKAIKEKRAESSSDEGAGGKAPKEDENANQKREARPPFRLKALLGDSQEATVAVPGRVFWVGAAPLYQRSKIIGAVIVDAALQSLPHTAGAMAFVMASGKVGLGKPPAGFDASSSSLLDASDKPIRVAKTSPRALLFGVLEVPISPMFVESDAVGIWGQRLAVPGTKKAAGFVVADMTPVYVEIASLQAVAILALALLWFVHVAIIVLAGRRLRVGIDRISDFLGRVQQGIGDEKQFPETQAPGELVRLVRLVNRTVGQRGPGQVAPLPKAPSLDEVLQAQEVEPPPDIAELEFEGITDSGSIESSPETPSQEQVDAQEDFDGYESLNDVADAAVAEVEEVEQQTAKAAVGGLPDVPEAFAAVEHLAQDSAAAGMDAEAVASSSSGFDFGTSDDLFSESPSPAAASEQQPSAASAQPGDWWDDAPAPATAMAQESMAPTEVQRPAASSEAAPGGDLGDMLDEFASDATSVMQLSPELIAAMQRAKGGSGADAQADEELAQLAGNLNGTGDELPDLPAAPPTAPPPDPSPSPVDPTEQHYRRVFDAFLATRRSCGESTGELTFDKFSAKLEKSRDAVIARHNCSDVRFEVFVKNGKAALKAVPAR